MSLPTSADTVIVGGGILGLAVAREHLMRHPGASLCVIEKEDQVGSHQTCHNSGVIHAGIYYKPGSLKARLCVAGARQMLDYCAEHHIPAKRNGKLVVALDQAELSRLDELERRATANGVGGLRRLTGSELREVEPHVTGIAALHSPDTGVVDFSAVTRSIAAEVTRVGGVVVTGCAVESVTQEAGGLRLGTTAGSTLARSAIFAAGGWADRLAGLCGADAEPRILPFRGAWMRLLPEHRDLVKAHIYPVPDPDLPFLGVHFSRGIDDTVLVGPTALLVGARDAYRLSRVRLSDVRSTLTWPGTYRMARTWWRTGLREMHQAASRSAWVADARRYVPELTKQHVTSGPSGVRAQAVARDGTLLDDFVISDTPYAVHVRNAPSPAATAAFALAEMIVDHADRRFRDTG